MLATLMYIFDIILGYIRRTEYTLFDLGRFFLKIFLKIMHVLQIKFRIKL